MKLSTRIVILFSLLCLAYGVGFIGQNYMSGQAQAATPAPEANRSEPVGIKSGDILLVYPRGENNNKIDCASTFLIGAVCPGKTLSCNGRPVNLNSEGYFAYTVKLNYGKNKFALACNGEPGSSLAVVVERPAPSESLSVRSFTILSGSLEPHEDMGLSPGDIVQFAARATPGCQMSVYLGGQHIVLKPALRTNKKGKIPAVNLGLDTAFGVSFERRPAALKDLYLGFYRIQATDNWQKAQPVFVLKKDRRTLKRSAEGRLTVVRQPQLLETAHNDTIVRFAPGAARTTPLPQSVRMLADGFKGEWQRLELCPGRHVWIAAADMFCPDDLPAPVESKVTTINLGSDGYGARLCLPLNQRLPYQIEQDIDSRRLKLAIFGATADTDFVTGDLHPENNDAPSSRLIDYVSWKQKADGYYELTVQLKHKQQWGFWADYENKTLVLHLKSAPVVDLSLGTLRGAVICVDPGHGGSEIGSVGCSGVKEATVNFQIADRLKANLEAMGARVVMTRSGDKFVSLQDRVNKAVAEKADLLISIHNNALPDGRDPLVEHGTSSYWYHPQSHELALILQKELVKTCGSKDFACRYQNLALCRPGQIPAVLLEIGFMINPDEYARLLNAQFQEQAARSIAGSIKNFLYEKIKTDSD